MKQRHELLETFEKLLLLVSCNNFIYAFSYFCFYFQIMRRMLMNIWDTYTTILRKMPSLYTY